MLMPDGESRTDFESLQRQYSARVELWHNDGAEPDALFSTNKNRRRLDLGTLARRLQRIPEAERAGFQVVFPWDAHWFGTPDFAFEKSILSQFQLATMDEANKLMNLPILTLETIVTTTRRAETSA